MSTLVIKTNIICQLQQDIVSNISIATNIYICNFEYPLTLNTLKLEDLLIKYFKYLNFGY